MPVPYEELSGSPKLVMNREGGSATRVIRIAWGNIKPLLREVFPSGRLGWLFGPARLNGYPWLRASEVTVEPFDDFVGYENQYISRCPNGARVTIQYEPLKFEGIDNESEDKDSPSEIVFVENEFNVTGEYLTWPNQSVRWERDGNGSVVQPGASAKYQRDVQVSEEIKVGIVIPIIEHTLTWNYAPRIPWSAIRRCIGAVNKKSWSGTEPNTLLFTGLTASRQYTNFGAKAWKVTYKLSEKNLGIDEMQKQKGDSLTKSKIKHIGWNHFLRPLAGGSRWDRLLYNVNGEGGPKTVYREEDFSDLFRFTAVLRF